MSLIRLDLEANPQQSGLLLPSWQSWFLLANPRLPNMVPWRGGQSWSWRLRRGSHWSSPASPRVAGRPGRSRGGTKRESRCEEIVGKIIFEILDLKTVVMLHIYRYWPTPTRAPTSWQTSLGEQNPRFDWGRALRIEKSQFSAWWQTMSARDQCRPWPGWGWGTSQEFRWQCLTNEQWSRVGIWTLSAKLKHIHHRIHSHGEILFNRTGYPLKIPIACLANLSGTLMAWWSLVRLAKVWFLRNWRGDCVFAGIW